MASRLESCPSIRSGRKFRRICTTALAAITAAALVACGADNGGQPAVAGPPDPTATLRVAANSIPRQFDPTKSVGEALDFPVLSLIYDRLLTLSPTGKVEPGLVTNWEYSEDGLSLTLMLREDVKFHDGTSLDATAVVMNLERGMNSDAAVSQRLANLVSVSATGPYEVRLSLAKPTTELLAALTQLSGLVINPTLLASGDPGTATDGSGPYLVDDFMSGATITLTRADDFDTYWDQEAAKLARIEFTRMTDSRATTNAMRGGQLDAALLVEPERVEDLRSEIDRGTIEVTNFDSQHGLMLYFNRASGPLDKLEVRQAINHAIDRETLVASFHPGSEAAIQMWRESDPLFNSGLGDPYPYETEKARELLEAAGYPDGIDLGTILVANSIPAAFGEAVQAMLAEVGVVVQLQQMDAGQIIAEYARGAAPMVLNYTSGYGSPAATLGTRMGKAFNPAGTTAEYDALFTAANDNRISLDEQTDRFREASTYVVNEAWFAPIVWTAIPWASTPRVTGFAPSEMNYSSVTGVQDWRYVGLAQD